jgi:CheY-like chemotaxis protein
MYNQREEVRVSSRLTPYRLPFTRLLKGQVMAKKTILVVDDTDWNRDLLVQLLEEDYTLLQAVDGADGVRMAEEHKPDLILMDLGMPIMDGWEATRTIKANDALKTYPDHRRHLPRHGRRRDRTRAKPAAMITYPNPSTTKR